MIHIFPGTALYNQAFERGIIKDKIDFLKAGCPLINVSHLSDDEYKDLSSLLYEKNMRPKYQPEIFSVGAAGPDGACKVEMKCNKCGFENSFSANILHWKRILCPQCRQRHYVDPFKKISHSQETMERYFYKNEEIALWGAGEICIKLLDNYSVFGNNNFKVVDISKSRQGYTVCGKEIFSPEIINKENIKTVVIAVVARKNEILGELSMSYPSVEKIYLPDISNQHGSLMMILRELKN
jgi:hypothetical protein